MIDMSLNDKIWDGTVRWKLSKIGGSVDDFVDQAKLNELQDLIYNTIVPEIYAALHIRQKETRYEIGEIAYSNELPSYCRLECINAGTTSQSNILELVNVNNLIGNIFTDGTVIWIIDDVRDGTPVGGIRLSNTLPSGYVKANGSELQRSGIYSRLFRYANTNSNMFIPEESTVEDYPGRYGLGDGNDTFTVPDLRNKIPYYLNIEENENLGEYVEAGLPNITGSVGAPVTSVGGVSGAFYITATGVDGIYSWSSSSNNCPTSFDASRSSEIYGKSTTVQPDAIKLFYIIKY